jgi:hypothetical protein
MAVCACSMGMLKLLPPLSTTATVSATLSSQVGDQLFFPSHPFFSGRMDGAKHASVGNSPYS